VFFLWAAGRLSVFAGMSGRPVVSGSSVTEAADAGTAAGSIDEWHKCVKQLSVSSRESQAHHLIEGQEGCWQSSGTQGKVLPT